MKISIWKNEKDEPIFDFSRNKIAKNSQISDLNTIYVSSNMSSDLDCMTSLYSLAQAFIVYSNIGDFCCNMKDLEEDLDCLKMQCQALLSKQSESHEKDKLCGRPPISHKQQIAPALQFGESMRSIDNKLLVVRNNERKKNVSSAFIKLNQNSDEDFAIERLRERKLSEQRHAEREQIKVKFQRNLSSHAKKSSLNRLPNDFDPSRTQSRSQFRKKNIQQFLSVSSSEGPKLVLKVTEKQCQEISFDKPSNKVFSIPLGNDAQQKRISYLKSVGKEFSIPVQTLHYDNKIEQRQLKKPQKRQDSIAGKALNQRNPKASSRFASTSNNKQKNCKNWIKVSSIWKQHMEQILEQKKGVLPSTQNITVNASTQNKSILIEDEMEDRENSKSKFYRMRQSSEGQEKKMEKQSVKTADKGRCPMDSLVYFFNRKERQIRRSRINPSASNW